LSPMAKGSIRQVHNASTRGLKVTRKTLGIVQDVSDPPYVIFAA
jgi:hypothetical protein